MSILLDTSVFLWAVGVDKRLRDEDRKLLTDTDVPIFLSAATAWEISIKWSKGRLDLPEPPDRMIEKIVSAAGFTKLAVGFREAYAVAELPRFPNHKDPFDRLIVAQARVHGLRLMTSDKHMTQYDVDVIFCKAP